MMVQVHAKTRAPSARWTPKALRRLASVCLLLGLGAFLLVATLQSCCRLAVAQTHPISASTGVQSAAFDHHGGTGHQPSDFSEICVDITIAAGLTLVTAVHSFGGEQPATAYPAFVMQEGYAMRRAIYAIEYPPFPPPRPLPFYLRTSRILI